jgi:hypothetical protein
MPPTAQSTITDKILALIIALLALCALLLNSIILLAFATSRMLRRKESLYYIALLSVIDLINALSYTLPLMYHALLFMNPIHLTSLQCLPIIVLPPVMLIACPLGNIAVIADRYFAITIPLRHRKWRHKHNVVYTFLLILVLGAGVAIALVVVCLYLKLCL